MIRQMAEVVIISWCRSRTDSPDGGTDIATLLRRALAEACTVPVLLVWNTSCELDNLGKGEGYSGM